MKRLSYCVSILLIYIEKSYCVPEPNPGEKIKFNAEDFEKLAKYANLTKRDHTAKNVNFAWKVTMGTTITTTTDPRHTSTLNEELSKKNSEIYDKLFAQLAYTLRDKVYLDRWLNEMDKGYHIFLYELQKQDKWYFFKRHYDDDVFDKSDGSALWYMIVDLLEQIGSKRAFKDYMKKIRIDVDNHEKNLRDFTVGKPNESEKRPTLTGSYKTMQLYLTISLKNSTIRQNWADSCKKGFDIFIQELYSKGCRHYLYCTPEDPTFLGAKGGLVWYGIVGYIRNLEQRGVERLFDKIDNLPANITADDILDKKLLDISSEENIHFTKTN